MSYIMESRQETDRLARQAVADGTYGRIDELAIQAGASVLDVGCGPGVGSERFAERVGPGGRVLAIDRSPERVAEARARNAARPWVRCEVGDVFELPVEPGSFDLAWSQFLFEYLPDRPRALASLIRAVRPGGRVVVSEIDAIGLFNWPMDPALVDGWHKVANALSRTGFDVFVGRKLYGEFRAAGLQDIQVRLSSFYISPGAADARLQDDWRIRFDALAPLAAAEFGGLESYRAFADAYLEMLKDPAVLKYAPVLVTEGTRP